MENVLTLAKRGNFQYLKKLICVQYCHYFNTLNCLFYLLETLFEIDKNIEMILYGIELRRLNSLECDQIGADSRLAYSASSNEYEETRIL